MQRYRVNYRLLISLIVGMSVAAPAAYGLWWFQVDRNATRLLAKADAAEASGDFETAYDSLDQYVKLRPDEIDARIRLGEAAVKLADKEDLDIKLRSESYYALIDAVLRSNAPGAEGGQRAADLRRKLIDLHMRYGFMDNALQSINELLADKNRKSDPQDDRLLRSLKAQCLFMTQNVAEGVPWAYALVGYDRQTDQFSVERAQAADQPLAYFLLAQHLIGNRQSELGERVIAQMVEANPESREAYVYQYQVLKALMKPEEARTALDRAYELDPTDAVVLLSKAIEAIADYQQATADAVESGDDEAREKAAEHLDAAAKLLAEGLERYPDRIPFYDYAARVELMRERYDDALAIIERGLEKFDLKTAKNSSGMPVAIDLAIQRIDVLLVQENYDRAAAEIKALRALDNVRVVPLADYYAARLEMAHQNWLVAARMFNDVKTRLISSSSLQAAASASQGLCHERLNQFDLALKAYEWALDKNPGMAVALAGKERMLAAMGQTPAEGTPLQFDQIVREHLELPPAQQNWAKVEEQIAIYVREQAQLQNASEQWIDSRIELLKAQMFVTRAAAAESDDAKSQLFAAARDAISAANRIDPNDIQIQLAAPRVLMLEPKSGPAKALGLLDTIIERNKKRGVDETLPFRLLRIDLLFAVRDENVATQLHAAAEGIDGWPKDQQAQVWAAIGARLEQLGQLQDAAASMEMAATLMPGLLPYRMALFELARKQADDPAMRAAQEKILELVGSKSDPDYVLAEVKRVMVNFAANAATVEDLKRARTLLDQAIQQRPTWAELYVLSGQLALLLEQDANLALQQLNLALEKGPTNLNALNLQIRLLADIGRFAEARSRMDRIPRDAWAGILERTAAIVLGSVGEKDQAYFEAKKLANAYPNDPSTQIWFAAFAAEAKHFDEAENALKKAIDLQRSDPDAWTALLNFYMTQRRAPEVEATLRQAQLELDEEYLPLLTAQQHRLFGRFSQAESILESAYAARLDDIGINQRMAEFYLAWAEQEALLQTQATSPQAAQQLSELVSAHRGQAKPFVNRILRATYEGKVPGTNPIVQWARRQAARLLSLSGDYQDSLKAEQLLTAAFASNTASPEGQDLLIDLLNRRGDPASRERVIAILRQIQEQRGLTPQLELQLGQALFDIGDWDASLRQMQEAINRNPNDPALRVGLIEMLIDRKEFGSVDRWMSRLASIKEAEKAIPQLRIRLAAARGDKAEVRKLLESMTPNLLALTPQQLQVLHAVGLLADSVGDHEYALKLIQEYSARVDGQNDLELAQFTVLYGDLDTGLRMLSRLFPANKDQVLNIGLEALRSRRKEDPAKLDAAVDLMVRQALRDDPDSARRMVLQAEALELQEKFEEAIAAYERLLGRDDVPKLVRATALNNLAFLLAMSKRDLDRALAGVNEAMEIIGPISDILDTRALVYFHSGRFAEAVEDLRLAVKMNSTASKYFHLTMALLAVGDNAAALEAWKQAELKGILADVIPDVELEDFERTRKQIETLRGGDQT